MIPTEAYPLTWPAGRPRTQYPKRSNFDTTLGVAIKDVQHEVRLLGGSELIISSNFSVKANGMPYANQRRLKEDNGVVVYFMLKKKPMCFACDRWDRFEDNLRAIAKAIDALRGISRWGTGDMVEQAFTGFTALPAPTSWWQTLELDGPDVSRDDIQRAWRSLASRHHPDNGGDTNKMADINRARDLGLESCT